MNWAISNLTGGNRVSRAILVRYSSVPLAEDGVSTPAAAATPRASASAHSSLSSTFAATFLHSSSSRHVNNNNSNSNNNSNNNNNNNGGTCAAGATPQLSLPLDVEETVTCFCRKARRKERDGDQNSTDTKLYLEESVLERKLPEADLKALVDLPAGLDYNEWLASHTLALFEHVNLVYGTISEFCTQSGCADMTGPGNRTYLWFDEKGKKTRVAAPQYIDYVMTFTQKTVSDESIFPTKYANEFPGSFESIARKILRLQFHVIAHLYAAHFREIALLGLHTHLNLTFMHLTALHRRFNLIDEKETDVLRDLEVALRLTDDNSVCGHDSLAESGSTSVSATATASVSAGNCEQQQQQHSSSNSNSNSSGEALHVNSQSICGTSAASPASSLIDGDAAAPPICTQPEAGAAGKPPGSGGLLGGILGDLTSGEFGDTTRYCTSAVPPHAAGTDAAAAAGANTLPPNGATNGAIHLNFSNNNSNNHNLNHLNHHHHHHTHHHHHHHHPHTHLHHLQQQAAAGAGAGAGIGASPTTQHSGLIQCNAAGAAASAGGGGGGNSSNSNTTATT
ncbi:MOB kinase activator-like 2 isoform X2 [Drosophila virilis]|uniref:MOB kinase activator-like 2 isoform X2 n=1 Tax=Drosophila virilis TaxID=7244 RepID=UPI001395CD5E|nr:MOB kinase activator-like 2 isoform X2 [Drosophila virilis]